MCIMSLSIQKRVLFNIQMHNDNVNYLYNQTRHSTNRTTPIRRIPQSTYYIAIIWNSHIMIIRTEKRLSTGIHYLDLRSVDTIVVFIFARYLYLFNIWSPPIQKQTLHLFSFYPLSYTVYSHFRLVDWVVFAYTLIGV